MITNPIVSGDHLHIGEMVSDFVKTTFPMAHVRDVIGVGAAFDEPAWQHMVELGWTGLSVAPDAGGADLGAFVQCIVHRELGAALAPTPYLATAGFAVSALNALGGTDRARDLLAAVAAKPVTLALVLGHGRGWTHRQTPLVTATRADSGWSLDGAVPLVAHAPQAETLVVVAALDGGPAWGMFRVSTAGARLESAVPTIDATRAFGDARFHATPADPLHAQAFSADDIDALTDRLAVFLAAEMTGAALACMRQTTAYLATREQFGRPIGSFQALKHRCADLAVALSTAQEIVFAAAATADSGDHGALGVFGPLALARAGEAFTRTAEEAIQLHGGVGFTDELDLGLFYKRALSDSEILAAPIDAYARADLARVRWSA